MGGSSLSKFLEDTQYLLGVDFVQDALVACALLGILSFHLGIALLMGLPWFSLTMIAVDAIFIRDRSFAKVSAYLRHWLASSAPSSPSWWSGRSPDWCESRRGRLP